MDEFLTTDEVTQVIKNAHCFECAFTTDLKEKQYVLNFDETKTLSSFSDMTFSEMCDEFGFGSALCILLFGTTEKYQDSIKNIKCIETMSGMEISKALKVSDEVFASTYYVALSDVPNIKSQMKNALSNNESFVFVRFDVFDYYADYTEGVFIENNSGVHTDYDDSVLLFQTKYYENLDILRMETSNGYATNVYDVEMEEIDTSSGATVPKPIRPAGIGNGYGGLDLEKFFKDLMRTISIIFVVIVVLVIFIYFAPVIVPVIKAILAFFKKISVAIGNGIKRLTNRRKQ